MDNIRDMKGCEDDCPVKKFAGIIEGKWTTLVIRELLPNKKRFSEIQRALAGISPKVLTARLRLLEEKQLVTRTVYPTVPPMTEYELTSLGLKLEPVLNSMAEFGMELQKNTKAKKVNNREVSAVASKDIQPSLS